MWLKVYYSEVVAALSALYPQVEAQELSYRLFEHFLHFSKIDIALNAKKETARCNALDVALGRLLDNEPLQYVTGVADFYDLEFNVTPAVLIPRPETEELVRLILDNHQGEFSILDIGTGSACIPVSIKKKTPAAHVSACDISEEALVIAQSNAIKNGVDVHFFTCNILEQNDWPQDRYNIIVSNPPYVREAEKELMRDNVLDYEPHLALFVKDNDPLIFYRTIAKYATSHLYKGGSLYFEINEAYGPETKDLLDSYGFIDVSIHQDIFGKDRIISAKF